MKLLKNKESGQALIWALILLALGSLLIVPLLRQTFTNLKYHQTIECLTLTSYSADSGVQYALTKLYNKPGGYTEYTEEDYLIASFDLNDRTVNVAVKYMLNGVYKITSVASGGGCAATTITAYVNLSVGSFAFVVAAKESMTITGSTVNADEPGGANIHSNGDIFLNNSVIDGNATAFGTIEGEECAITATWPSPPLDFPGDYSELYKTMALEGEDSPYLGDLTVREDQDLGPLYIEGNLIVEPGIVVTLGGTVYVTEKIFLRPRVQFIGDEHIIAEGDILIEGGDIISEYIPLVMSTNGDITVKRNIVNAVVYAPNGTVTLEAFPHLYGAVGGTTVIVGTGSQITYAALLHGRQDLPGGELHTISYSYE